MKLVSLKLLNYRRFRQEEIFFKDDFTLIFGKNGSGKSSILDAIGYALFGPSSKDFVRVNSSLLKSHFIKDRQPSKIELVFQVGMENYRIIRVIDAGIKKLANDFITESKDSLYGPDGLEIIGGGEVTNYLQTLVGINRDTFLRSVFAKQKDLEVLSGTREERKKLINSILGLDKIEYLIIDNKKSLKEKKILKDYMQNSLENFDFEANEAETKKFEELLKQELKEFKKIEEDKQKLEKKYSEIKKNYEAEENKFKEFSNNKDKLNLENNTLENNKKQLIDLEKNLEEISLKQKEIESKKDIPQKRETILKELNLLLENRQKFTQKKSLEKDLEEKNIQKKNLEKDFLKYKNSNFELQLKNSQEKIENFEKEIKIFQDNLVNLKAEVTKLITDGKELKAEFETFKSLGESGDCPTCKRPIEKDFPNIIKFFEDKISKKRQDYVVKNKKLQDEELKLNEKNKLLIEEKNIFKNLSLEEKNYILLKNNLENIQKNILDISKSLEIFKDINFDEKLFDKTKKSYDEIEIEFRKYNILLGEISKKEEIIKNIQTKKDLEKNILENIKSLEKKLLEINFDEKKYELNKKEFSQINSQIFEINTLISSKQKEINEIEFKIKNLLNQLKEVKDSKDKITKMNEEIIYLNLKNEVLNEYIIYLLNYLKPSIENLASQYFAIITDNRYSSISLDDDYNILIDSKSIDLYSGGERDLANLCLRLSLGQNISGNNANFVNFLILDEILASQDKGRQQNILVNFKKLENKFSQIFLISHVDDIKEMATNMIEITQKNIDESVVNYY